MRKLIVTGSIIAGTLVLGTGLASAAGTFSANGVGNGTFATTASGVVSGEDVYTAGMFTR